MARPVTGCVGFAKTAGDGGGSGRASATSRSHRGQRIRGEPRTRWRPDGSIGKPAARGRSSPSHRQAAVPPDAEHPVMYLMPAGTAVISNILRVVKAPIATGDTAGLR